MANTPNYLGNKNSKCTVIGDSDGTSELTVFTAGANGARVHLISASTNEATPTLELRKNDGTTTCIIATYQLPTNAGRANGAPAVDLMDSAVIPGIPSDPGQFLTLGPNETLKIALQASLSTGKNVHIIVDGVDY